jgi:hypothetical protein
VVPFQVEGLQKNPSTSSELNKINSHSFPSAICNLVDKKYAKVFDLHQIPDFAFFFRNSSVKSNSRIVRIHQALTSIKHYPKISSMTLHFPLSASVPVRIFNILIAYCVQISISAFLFADETIMSLVNFTFLIQIIQIKTDTIFDL